MERYDGEDHRGMDEIEGVGEIAEALVDALGGARGAQRRKSDHEQEDGDEDRRRGRHMKGRAGREPARVVAEICMDREKEGDRGGQREACVAAGKAEIEERAEDEERRELEGTVKARLRAAPPDPKIENERCRSCE